jgi:hypothetical protein
MNFTAYYRSLDPECLKHFATFPALRCYASMTADHDFVCDFYPYPMLA